MEQLINSSQFSIAKREKDTLLADRMTQLHAHHLQHCKAYASFAEILLGERKPDHIEDFPFIPVSAFKNYKLQSIPDDQVYKVLTSSGTTGSAVSKIILDKAAAQAQTVSLAKIINHILGKDRLPMLIVDSKDVLKNRASFSARGAGILGLSIFGRDQTYVLDEEYNLNKEVLLTFLKKHEGQPIFIFGFTFMVWQHLMLTDLKDIDLSNATLIHSGGWKKMIEMAVTNDIFKAQLRQRFGIHRVYNFYGMIEQIGSIFIENSQGYLHCPNFATIIIRNPKDFSVQKIGEPGLIQVVSALPESYPGYSILTEDIGICMGEDDAENGWKGKYFKILGRAKKAELRGCSDVNP